MQTKILSGFLRFFAVLCTYIDCAAQIARNSMTRQPGNKISTYPSTTNYLKQSVLASRVKMFGIVLMRIVSLIN